jgi:hypothetical protein
LAKGAFTCATKNVRLCSLVNGNVQVDQIFEFIEAIGALLRSFS